jgi:hypothetical protein
MNFRTVLFLGVLFLSAVSPRSALAAMDPGEERVEFARIHQELAEIKENQKKILEGQDRLSEEHKQLRYFTYRK